MVVSSVGRSVAEEGARVITALPTAKVLSTARQMVASQIVLIILMPQAPIGPHRFRRLKGGLKVCLCIALKLPAKGSNRSLRSSRSCDQDKCSLRLLGQ